MKDVCPGKAACCLPGEPGGRARGTDVSKFSHAACQVRGGWHARDDNMASAVAGGSCPACALLLPGALSAWCCHMPQCATSVPHCAACVPHRVACVPHHAACLRTTLCCVRAPSRCPPPCPIMLFVSVLHHAACLPHCTACVPRVGAELGMLWRKEQRQGVPLRTAQYGVKLGMLFKSDKVLSNILEVRDAGTGDDLASKGWLGLWVAQLSQGKNDQAVACLSVWPNLQTHRVHNSPENWVRVKVHSLVAEAGGTSGATAASGTQAAATGAPPGGPCSARDCAPPLLCPAASNAADSAARPWSLSLSPQSSGALLLMLCPLP